MISEFLTLLFHFIAIFIVVYILLIFIFYIVIFIISAKQLRHEYLLDQKEPYEDILDSGDTKPVSIIVPAYNEEVGVYSSVRSLLSINYPQFEVIVINDGSKDKTLQVMIEGYKMVKTNDVIQTKIETEEIRGIYRSTIHENVILVDKNNGGKSDALNAGINVAAYPYICCLDGDSILERDALLKVMKPVIDTNGEAVAVGGSIRIANGCIIDRGEVMQVKLSKHPLVIMQIIEYLRAFLMGRMGLSKHNILLIISGAFGLFEKEWILKIGGYRTDTVGEDMDLIVRLHRYIKENSLNKKIMYVPDPVCWTEAPESVKILRRQRSRWHRGLFECLWTHKRMLFNPKYGKVGLISMPYFLFIEFLSVFIELFGYIMTIFGVAFGFLSLYFGLLLFLMSFLYGSLLSMSGVLLEEWSLRKYPRISDLNRLFLFALSETFWYRPMTLLWRAEGMIQVITKKKSWGEMTRKGISQ